MTQLQRTNILTQTKKLRAYLKISEQKTCKSCVRLKDCHLAFKNLGELKPKNLSVKTNDESSATAKGQIFGTAKQQMPVKVKTVNIEG
jgi:hypothetical protein